MMELMPHRRRRKRAAARTGGLSLGGGLGLGLGALSPSSRASAGGFGGGALYSVVDMNPITDPQTGAIDGGTCTLHGYVLPIWYHICYVLTCK